MPRFPEKMNLADYKQSANIVTLSDLPNNENRALARGDPMLPEHFWAQDQLKRCCQ